MRLDRLITLSMVAPLTRRRRKGETLQIPVLMYHSITDQPESGVGAYYQTTTSPTVFRRQMQCIAEWGYRSVSLEQLNAGVRTGNRPAALNSKSIVITFDDGFANFLTEAYPALAETGLSATMFLPTAFIQESRRAFKGTDCLTWDEVRQLHAKGIEFGSHTVNHPRLVDLAWPEVDQELRQSKRELEAQLGQPARTFAYPYAFPQANRAFVQPFLGLLKELDYSCCVTTEVGRVGLGDDPYRLKRLPANGLDDPGLLRAKLEGSYDWLGVVQGAVKKLKAAGKMARSKQGGRDGVRQGK